MSRKKNKNQVINGLKVVSYAAEGKCIAHSDDGKVVFIEKTVPGDIVDVLIIKSKAQWADGKVIKLVEPSPQRIPSFCAHFGVCGGCKWQMLPYELQLNYKQQQVKDQLERIGHLKLPEMLPIIGSDTDKYYRNKLEFTFSTNRYFTNEEIAERSETLVNESVLGFHAPGLFDKVVAIEHCYLQPEPTNLVLSVLRNYTREKNLLFYDARKQEGWLRNVTIRVATTGETLINIVFHHDRVEERESLLHHLLDNVPNITSLNYTLNPKMNDTIYDREVICYAGSGYITEVLGDLSFKISPKSFFQTNTLQAEKLYNTVKGFAELTGTETIYDLYCGTGSIGIFCSAQAKKVIGIETVEDAIVDARENALLNGKDNCEFFAGDVTDIWTDSFIEQNGMPDIVITDPPRVGMHPKMVAQLLKIQPNKIIYVSCNPATQARDLQMMKECYKIDKLQPVDMFPHTHHIENVALLSRI